MFYRAPFALGFGLLLAASLAGAAPADSGPRIAAASAPAGTDSRITLALSDAVRLHVSQAGLEPALKGYTVSPALIQLRRYVEPGRKQAKSVCVVDLTLSDGEHRILASTRGNVAAIGASTLEVVDAAASSAVSRLPQTLSALQGTEPGRKVAAR